MKTTKVSKKIAIIATAGVIILIGVIYFAYLLNENFEKSIISQRQQELFAVAKTIEISLTGFLEGHSEMLAVISGDSLIQRALYEKKECAEIEDLFWSFRNIYEANINDVSALILLDRNGIVLLREPYMKDRIGIDNSDSPGVAYVIGEHKPYIGEVFDDNISNLAVLISEPIFYKDEFVGVVACMIGMDIMARRFIEPVKLGNEGFVWMFDRESIVLSHRREDYIGLSVLDVIKKMHKERGEVFDESRTQEHIIEEHDYLNRVKSEGQGYGIFINCITDEEDVVAYRRVEIGNAIFNLVTTSPYAEIVRPINEYARKIFGLAWFVVILVGAGGLALFKSQKEKAALEAEGRYLKQIANGAEALRESEERYRKLVEGTEDLVTRMDSNGRFTYINGTSEKIFGLSPEECIGLSAFHFTHPDDREKTKAAFAGWGRERISNTIFENRQVSQRGQVHYMLWAINPEVDEDGNLAAINSIGRDLTDLRLAEEALAAERERLEVTLRSIGDGVISTDSEGKIILINKVAEKLTGWAHQEAIGKPLGDVLHVVDEVTRERRENPVDQVIKRGKVIRLANHTILISKDGTEIVISDSAAPILDAGNDIIGVVLVFSDVTERRKMEANIQESMRMNAIATLAGGIAHEFNNALAGVSGNIELLGMDMPDDKDIDKYAKPMMDSVHRMAGLTSQLLAYAKGGMCHPKTLSLNDLVRDTLPVIQHNITSTIQIESDLSADISNVKVDYTQMQMVLSAVLTNASEAMEDKGRIRIITRKEEVDEVFAKTNPDLKPGSYVCLTIEDEGKGMDKETASRVFEPFFTTKFLGRGLGMAATYGIIKNHGGSISLYSELGKGTVVRIYLPAMEAQAEQARETEVKGITRTETILVVEDEEFVIEVIHQMLKGLGYRILLAKSGSQAVDIAKTFEGAIDLAMLDIVLPDMDGSKLYPLLMKARPNLKVIVCSGYDLDGPAQEILEAGAQDFIQKPFSLETLSRKLRKVLTATT
jgi:two-component system cell cycle sensor histidine kinase/response regulator CckA